LLTSNAGLVNLLSAGLEIIKIGFNQTGANVTAISITILCLPT
jgi:hypothetical protein